MDKDLTIVGIGASAGGLEALKEFFTHIPDDTGLAFVVVQHLSPDFKSLMDELLAKHTKMPIKVIEENVQVQPNHIYLISHSNNIIIKDGIIRQVERKPTTVLNLPIDEFFHSLGIDKKDKSIGIILSGTGTDGSRGVRTIKEEGGMVMVQDPDTAKFNGMPLAAISIGLSDSVLNPKGLAQELARIASAEHDVSGMLDENNDGYRALLDKILQRVTTIAGVNFLEYRRATLIRRLEKRMFVKNIHSLYEYYMYLLKNEEETQMLFKEFLIGVTRFFRDKEAFAILNDIVIPSIFRNKSKEEVIRIWVTGSSTGEEAYSIGMLMEEHIEANNLQHQYKIFATDVDKRAIQHASEGIYLDNIVADVGQERMERFFRSQKGNKFQINKEIRQRIVFAVHDALQDPPFINTDLISCRNMLIYLKSTIQQTLISNFQFALNQGGYLFLGPSESIGDLKKAFAPVSQKWNIYQNVLRDKMLPITRKRNTRQSQPESKRRTYNRVDKEETSIKVVDYKLYDEYFSRLLIQKHAPRCLFVNTELEILYINGNFEEILFFPQAVVKWNLSRMLAKEEVSLIQEGMRKVNDTEQAVQYRDVLFTKNEESLRLDLSIEKFYTREINETFYLIQFIIKGSSDKIENDVELIDLNKYKDERLKTLEFELWESKRERQNLIEQLETTNEELQSSNEELLAANEELQSTNEELQSVNEELYTVNTELQSKIDELTLANNDINNLLKSTEIGTIFLDSEMNIRKFTPTIQKQFDFRDSDIGRPITSFTNNFADDALYDDIKRVMENPDVNTIEREILDRKNNTYLLRILPYRTEKHKYVHGVVITFIDLNSVNRATSSSKRQAEQYRSIFENSNDLIALIDTSGIIKSINHSIDGYEKEDLLGKRIQNYAKGKGQEFEEYINAVAAGEKIEHFEIELLTKSKGEQIWLDVNITPITTDQKINMLTIIARDITHRKSQSAEIDKLNKKLSQ